MLSPAAPPGLVSRKPSSSASSTHPLAKATGVRTPRAVRAGHASAGLLVVSTVAAARGTVRHRRRHQRWRIINVHPGRQTRTARASIVASVAAAAELAKAAAFTASMAGSAAGIKDGVESLPAPKHKSGKKPKVVVLGSGWGAATFLQGLSEGEAQMYDITVVSPRNFFLYTPLLPASTMGTIEEKSIVTPTRKLVAGKGDFLEARCEHIDAVAKVVRCSRGNRPAKRADPTHERFPEEEDSRIMFDLPYDLLVYAVGAQTNDFGCPGVKEHAFFFKEAPDARRVRERISDNFEQASLPTTTPEEREQLLSFVVVGGGPTGVEVAADLADFINGEAKDLYPKIVDLAKIKLVNTGDNLLSTYDSEISKTSFEVFDSKGVEVMAGFRVMEITPDEVVMKGKSGGEDVRIPYGCCVWAAGIKEHALTSRLKDTLIALNEEKSELNVKSLKTPARGVITDEWLQVRGSSGSIFALGDAATVRHDRTLPFAKQFFEAADTEGTGELDLVQLRDLFKGASSAFPQLEEYAEYLSLAVTDTRSGDPRMLGVAKFIEKALFRERKAFKEALSLTSQRVGDRTKRKGYGAVGDDIEEADVNKNMKIDLEEFEKLLEKIDQNLQPFPPTAQVAAQQGKYLAKMFAKGYLDGDLSSFEETVNESACFTYFHKGALAYLGDGSAAFDLPVLGPVTGPAAGVAWKLYETSAQLSWKNRALVGLDWLRQGLFGRDSSRI